MHASQHRGTPWTILLAATLLAAVASPVPAAAQGPIEGIRLGRHPGYQRLVIDLGGADVAAYLTPDREQLLIEAAPPGLEPWMQRELEALGLRLEPSDRGTRLILDPERAPDWTAFRLGTGSPRVVLDLGPNPPGLPADAIPLPESPLLGETPELAPTRPGAPAMPPAPGLVPDVRQSQIRVQVRGITFLGLRPGGPSRDELLNLQLRVQLARTRPLRHARGHPPGRRRPADRDERNPLRAHHRAGSSSEVAPRGRRDPLHVHGCRPQSRATEVALPQTTVEPASRRRA